VAKLHAKPAEKLSADEARALILRAQGLDRPPEPGGSVDAMLRRLGAVQLDTISVLARSHELVAFSRLGPVARTEIEGAYWSRPARAFEYIGHAACVLPIELWPYFAFRRRAMPARERGTLPAQAFEEVRAHLRAGPVTTSEVGGGRDSPGWWNWSVSKIALEVLYRRGEVAITMRQGWRRVYDLAERVIPHDLLAKEPSDEECYAHLLSLSARALGVATARDLATYFYVSVPHAGSPPNARRLFAAALEAADLVPVHVEGWPEPAYADPAALSAPAPEPSRTTLLSPFDSLVWSSPRAGELKEREYLRRVFGFSYSFEAYVPAAKRLHGYFNMPILSGSRLVGLVDPVRRGKTLIANRITLENPEAAPAAAAALREAASWVGCSDIDVREVAPEALRSEVIRGL
jgi:uncharacterized protein YcaQ